MFGLFKKKKFVSEEDYLDNKQNQIKMTDGTLDQLYKNGVKPSDKRPIDFFFFTNSKEKAETLEKELQGKQYAISPLQKVSGMFSISGSTEEMIVDTQTLKNWVANMCDLGYQFDCEFDGWGTTN